MGRWLFALAALAVGAVLLWMTNVGGLFGAGDVQSKGAASDLTEWVKLAISVVSLLIGIVNLRIAMTKAKTQ